LGLRKKSHPQAKSPYRNFLTGVQSVTPQTILVVEDNELNKKMFSTLLSYQGHTVKTASNGLEAIEAVKSQPFDLIFMDVQMPLMDGLEACRNIRELEAGKSHIPIVALTAYAMQGDAQKCLDAGMDDYISKPIEPQLVFQVIENCVKKLYQPETGGGFKPLKIEQEKEIQILEFQDALPRFGNDPEYYKTLFDEFIQSLPEKLDEMANNLDANDWKGLSNKAHNLKGVSANFGIMQLSELAARLDQQSGVGNKDMAAGTLKDIIGLANHLNGEIIIS
jgi:CheY-like chemotaxis protein